MTTRRRAGRVPTAAIEEVEQGRPIIQPKPKKPTVAQNAQAIETLSNKISGVDAQLSTMNSLLAQLAASKNDEAINIVFTANVPAQPAQQVQPPGQPGPGQSAGPSNTVTSHCANLDIQFGHFVISDLTMLYPLFVDVVIRTIQ